MDNLDQTSSSADSSDVYESEFERHLRIGIWSFGNASWLFGITDRSIAAFSDGYLSAIDITQLFTASFFFAAWLFLKPNWRPLQRSFRR